MLVIKLLKSILKLKKNEKNKSIKRSGILTAEEASRISKERKSRSPNLIKGRKFVLVTGPFIKQMELHPLDLSFDAEFSFEISNETILSMLFLAQSALPYQFITSNLAEVFNSLHDRSQEYKGRKTIEHANRDLLAWALMRFYPKEAKRLIDSHNWYLPQNILSKVFYLIISEVNWS